MRVSVKQVDAFTSYPFGGNPAGVILDSEGISRENKQRIAREMGVSETAFVHKSDKADFRIEFFSPQSEVEIYGHIVISTFHALHEAGMLPEGKEVFQMETKRGIIPVKRVFERREPVFFISQPLPMYSYVNSFATEIADALGLESDDLMDTIPSKVSTGLWWCVVGVKKLAKLRDIRPDLSKIERLSRQDDVVGITAFCFDTFARGYDYHVRSFAPIIGLDEDPACATGNGSLLSYLMKHKMIKIKPEIKLIGEQGNELKRPGCVHSIIRTSESGSLSSIEIGGSAVTMLDGTMTF
ncbi:putative isomerase (plasmid) [Peptoclostridium acidaminophilum DSM 3953]|uniref:Putative isomerase n=1 Tax=Peptoclostridium acidaminophilum DSM 3953 TaxID=1286171 RepID=W8UB99_PEPAC|nr:PhzF family phenazine biosynthesis protein [Peptoclostridium acidaminophilum]AHM58056.1 putative isomerase [Peptoclostridium acidaminophilum DSM 3953]